MTLEQVVPLSDWQVKEIYYEVYNGFWRKYKDCVPDRNSGEWEQILKQARWLMAKHGSCPMVQHMVQDLLDQLERRCISREERR